MDDIVIKKEEIENYFEIENKLNDLSYAIFKYIKDNFINLLEYEQFSIYETFGLETERLSIKYFDRDYDIYEYNFIKIPLNYIYNNKWKEYIEKLEEKRLDKIHRESKREEEQIKEKELKLLKELKEKYE